MLAEKYYTTRAAAFGIRAEYLPRLLLRLIVLCLWAQAVTFTPAAESHHLMGHVPPGAAKLAPIGRLPANHRLRLALALSLRNQAQLDDLLQRIYTPGTAEYARYLTPDEFTSRFGPAEQDYQAVIDFAKTNGFTVTDTHPNRMLVDVEAAVGDIEKAFHLQLQVYAHPTERREFHAPDSEPSVEAAIPIFEISGLDNYRPPRPMNLGMYSAGSRSRETANLGSGPGGSYRGNDFRAAYVPDVTLTGAGQIVGLLQFDGYYASDIASYETLAGVPSVPLQNVLLDGFTNAPGPGNAEVALDIEMVISMAPGLSKVIVYSAGPFGIPNDILSRMATDNLAKQISSSWTFNVSSTTEQLFRQLAAQGQCFFNASGDSDAYPLGLVRPPTDNPNIVCVGGTVLTTTGPGGAWVSETVWNDGYDPQTTETLGSSGGESSKYSIPAWQQGISMSANQGSTTMRNIPDVAMVAKGVWGVCNNGQAGVFRGTSVSAPLWAAFLALVNQRGHDLGAPPVGFANPALYAIAKGAGYATTFHDITAGNNTSGASPTKYYAVRGYDLCTGWGTPAGTNLINVLVPAVAPKILSQPQNQTVIQGTNATFTVVGTGNPAPTYQWRLNGANIPGATASAYTRTNVQPAAAGNYRVFLSNSVGSVTSIVAVLTVLTPPSISTNPLSQTIKSGSNATFSVSAVGTAPLQYRWWWVPDAGGTATFPTWTNSSLTLIGVNATNAGQFYAVVTNLYGSVTSSPARLTVLSPPIITAQPQNQTVVAGTSASFNVQASGTTPLTYRWRFNVTNAVSWSTNSTLVISNAQPANAGRYSVVITNSHGSVTSQVAVLTVDQPPIVTLTSPTNGAVFVAPANVTLSATASDPDGTVARVDFFQGNTRLGTSTNSSYAFSWTGVGPGVYTLTALATDNVGAATTSAPVTVQVSAFINGLVAYYPFHSNINDASGFKNDGVLVGNDWAYSLGRFGQTNALYLNTNANPTSSSLGTYVAAPRSALLDFNQDFTLSLWVNIPNGLGPFHVHNLLSAGSDQTSANFRLISNIDTNTDTGGHDYLQLVGDTSGQVADVHALLPQVRNTWWQAVLVRSGTNASLFQNGSLVISGPWTAPMQNNPQIWIGAMLVAGYPLDGGIADVRIFNRALSAQEVSQLYQYEQHRLPNLFLSANPSQLSVFVAEQTTNLVESSTNLIAWSPWGLPFPATNWIIQQNLILSGPQQYFRVRQLP